MIREHRWIAKALAQKSISRLGLLPLYHRAQQIRGRLRGFHPDLRIEYAGKLAADIGLERLLNATVVEIGTGWVPVVPIALNLLGARLVHSFDLTRHLLENLTLRTLGLFPECLAELARRSGAPCEELRNRLTRIGMPHSFQRLCEAIGFVYHAPLDFTHSALAAESVDVVFSNLVLEHVTPAALVGILRESRRILRPGGVCWHNIDFTDHYAATLVGLSHTNFLRYSDWFWNAVG